MTPHVAPGEIPAVPMHPRPRSWHSAAYNAEHRTSTESLRLRSGLSFRELAQRSGLNVGRVHCAVTFDRLARPTDIARLRRLLSSEIRLRRSSDPAFLCFIQQIAVPFLRRAGACLLPSRRGVAL